MILSSANLATLGFVETKDKTKKKADLSLLVAPEEFRLIKHLSSFPGLIESCAQALEVHRVSFYLQELASLLHVFYYKHRVLPPKAGDGKDEVIESGPDEGEVEAIRAYPQLNDGRPSRWRLAAHSGRMNPASGNKQIIPK